MFSEEKILVYGGKIKILVATHKESSMPDDSMYLPIHVGAEGKTDAEDKPLDLGYIKDNTGDNISALNPYFCELTGLYWAWKNLDFEYVGLVQYRRFFKGMYSGGTELADFAISFDELAPMLSEYKIFVPKKRHYFIETISSHYEHTHDGWQLEQCGIVISEKYHEYEKAYKKVLKRRSGHMFNMMIMRKDLLDDYCSWLFDILFELFKRVGSDGMSAFDQRYPGRISEVLLNVWLEHGITEGVFGRRDIKELPYVEDVKWGQKIRFFFAAKFLGRKYGESAGMRSRTEKK